MESIEWFNEYLIAVATKFEKVSFRRKLLELQRIITYCKKGEGIESLEKGLILNDYSLKELMEYVYVTYSMHNILKELDTEEVIDELSNRKMVDYLKSYYFIAEDEDEAAEMLKDEGYIENPFEDAGKSHASMRKEDCFCLIKGIVDRQGWDGLHAMLEPYKNTLNIP